MFWISKLWRLGHVARVILTKITIDNDSGKNQNRKNIIVNRSN